MRVHFESPLGSVGNPYEAALDAPITASVPKGETVYYAWTATANGILILTAESDGSSIMLYNYTSFAVTGYTEGKGCVYVYVTEGDEVSIPVASNLPGDTNEVVFSLALSPATESAPMSIKAGNTTVKFSTGTTYYYVYSDETADAAIRAENVTVTVNGEAVTAAAGDRYIRFVANAGDVISITNTSEGNEDITLTLTKQG